MIELNTFETIIFLIALVIGLTYAGLLHEDRQSRKRNGEEK